jgi:tetratricopeptide (TPR) repeat protein
MNILNSLEENAIVITKGDDDLFPIWYVQYIEKRRTDVAPFNMILFKHPWHIEQNKSQHPYLSLSVKPQRIVRCTNPQGDGLDDISRSRLVDTVNRNYHTYPTYAYYIDCLSKGYSLVIEGLFCRVLDKANTNRQLEGLERHKDWLKFTRGIYEGKIKDRRGIETLKTYAMTYLNRGTTYFTLGRYKEAMEEFKAGIKIQPKSLELHYNLGGTYLNLGMRDEAIKEFEKVLEIDPDYVPAKNALRGLTSR